MYFCYIFVNILLVCGVHLIVTGYTVCVIFLFITCKIVHTKNSFDNILIIYVIYSLFLCSCHMSRKRFNCTICDPCQQSDVEVPERDTAAGNCCCEHIETCRRETTQSAGCAIYQQWPVSHSFLLTCLHHVFLSAVEVTTCTFSFCCRKKC